jgi:ubiquinone/menaquinone biosynthesis C-methylase UbiE
VNYEGPLADRYDAGRELTPPAEVTWRNAVEPYAADARVVLDVGAGTGRFAHRFAEHFEAAVIAVEPAAGMRSAAGPSPRRQRVLWTAGRAERLPFHTRTADVAWLAFVAHYLDLARTGAELARVLRRNGRALVWAVFPDRFDDLDWMRWFPAARAVDELRMPTVSKIAQAWEAAGLELLARESHPVVTASNLSELAHRIRQRAISSLELISDRDYENGLTALTNAASSADPAPVMSPHELLVFGLSS